MVPHTIKKNAVYPLKVTDMNNLGYGVGRIDNMVCFIANGVTGDEGEVRIIKVASTYLVGKWERLVSPSCRRLNETCSAFPRCGGCAFCHVDYSLERQIKTDFVKNTFRKSGLRHIEIVAPGEDLAVTGYRNKALIPIAADGKGKAYAGFFAPNSHRAVPCQSCLLQPKIFSHITQRFVDFLNQNQIAPYDETKDQGVIRHLYLRSVQNHTQVMMCAVVRDPDAFPVKAFTEFASSLEGVKSVYLNVQKERTNVVLGDECLHLWGEKTLQDRLCSLNFEISPLSFYQINHACASLIYQRAAQLAQLSSDDVLVDFYCGTGTIGLSMAKHVKTLYGIEIVADAVENARENARINGIENASFLCADAKEGVEHLLSQGVRPTVAVIDPPRKGTTQAFIDLFSQTNCNKLIYISCNPATLARDLVLFEKKGFTTQKAELYDMFPRTAHVESVVCLTRGFDNELPLA